MSTATVTYGSNIKYTGTITYTVSSTDTKTTFSATKFSVENSPSGSYYAEELCKAKIDGTEIYTVDGVNIINTTKTKSWNRTTSAQTKSLVLEIWVSGSKVATKTVSISVPALPTYTVSYNANGGTGTTASQTKTYGVNLTLRTNGFTKTNYAFKCWNTSTSDPSASRYAAGASYTGNAALALYAIWNPKIIFNANGGSGAPATQTKTFNTQFSLSGLATPTRTGYTFNKWNTAANGSGTSYASNGTIAASMNTAITLYAQWTANTYTITFNANGGNSSTIPGNISKTYGQAVTLPSTVPTRVGHTFLGWASSSSATSASWQAGGSYSEAITSTTTLYAVWRDDYTAPNISSFRSYRCGFELTQDSDIVSGKSYYTQSGTSPSYTYTKVASPVLADIATYYEVIEDDEAGYAMMEMAWSIDGSVDEAVVNHASVVGSITPEGSSTTTFYNYTSPDDVFSGAAEVVIYDLDVDTKYTISVVVEDVKGASKAVTRTEVLYRASYVMDFGSHGAAVGIGSAAPASGLEIGYETTFDQDVNMLAALKMNNVNIFNLIYPVGSIYMSVNPTDPGTLFGGTWQRITGRFLLSATDNGSSGASQAAGNTGGAATVTLTAAQSGVPQHTHPMGHRHTTPKLEHDVTQPTFSYTPPKSHSHNVGTLHGALNSDNGLIIYRYKTVDEWTSNWKAGAKAGYYEKGSYSSKNTNGLVIYGATASASASGDATPATRTKSVGVADHAAGYTGNSINASSTAARTSTDNNTAADASSAHDNMPPYLSVYVWKRTA